jgi:6-phosphogluconate dehydrogenase
MSQNNLGVIGLSTMGANLARNFARNGYQVAVFNRSYQKTQDLLEIWENDSDRGDGELVGYSDLVGFVNSLELPRKIFLLVKSGSPVDDFIAKLYPLLSPEDIIVDTGNSNWKDTQKRQQQLENGSFFTLQEVSSSEVQTNKKIHFVGSGVSGGEKGALLGPSLMPGGDENAINQILPILQKAAAKDFAGVACVTNIGYGASGHFVKMVHNGIEYGIMQGIAEIYDILKRESYSNLEISDFFAKVNHGKIDNFYAENPPVKLESFLIDITVSILKTQDPLSDQFLVDRIKDVAKSKGTGGWTVEAGLEFGAYTPTLAAAVFARSGSSRSQSFLVQTTRDKIEEYTDKETLEKILANGLESMYLACFLQGLDLIKKADTENHWGVDLQEVLRIWQGGCIIRTRLLANMWESWQTKFEFKQDVWGLSFLSGFNDSLPLPAIHSSLDYFQTLSSESLPTNLIQAQRDFFGAHTYQRNDKEGSFTGGWID